MTLNSTLLNFVDWCSSWKLKLHSNLETFENNVVVLKCSLSTLKCLHSCTTQVKTFDALRHICLRVIYFLPLWNGTAKSSISTISFWQTMGRGCCSEWHNNIKLSKNVLALHRQTTARKILSSLKKFYLKKQQTSEQTKQLSNDDKCITVFESHTV